MIAGTQDLRLARSAEAAWGADETSVNDVTGTSLPQNNPWLTTVGPRPAGM
jgi:hypothetical protein